MTAWTHLTSKVDEGGDDEDISHDNGYPHDEDNCRLDERLQREDSVADDDHRRRIFSVNHSVTWDVH